MTLRCIGDSGSTFDEFEKKLNETLTAIQEDGKEVVDVKYALDPVDGPERFTAIVLYKEEG